MNDPDFGADVDGWRRWYGIHKAGRLRTGEAAAKVVPLIEDDDERIRRDRERPDPLFQDPGTDEPASDDEHALIYFSRF